MKTYNLDTIHKVPLREVWPHEAHDFTKWLAEEQNLATLGTAVGIELELIETESRSDRSTWTSTRRSPVRAAR